MREKSRLSVSSTLDSQPLTSLKASRQYHFTPPLIGIANSANAIFFFILLLALSLAGCIRLNGAELAGAACAEVGTADAAALRS